MKPIITCFMAAICRDLHEGGDGKKYFGDVSGHSAHLKDARAAGLVNPQGRLTSLGARIGQAVSGLPPGRAYLQSPAYERLAAEVWRKR